MSKYTIAAVALAMFAAACGGASPDPTTASGAADPTTSVTTSSAANVSTTGTPDEAPIESTTAVPTVPQIEGPPAPDFELALADGSRFRLSTEQKPVYIVFWAEW